MEHPNKDAKLDKGQETSNLRQSHEYAVRVELIVLNVGKEGIGNGDGIIAQTLLIFNSLANALEMNFRRQRRASEGENSLDAIIPPETYNLESVKEYLPGGGLLG